MDMLGELRFWQQVVKDSERTVVCSPDMESRCKEMAKSLGLTHIKVVASPACPESTLLVIDENALKANLNQAMTKPIHFGRPA